MLPEYPARFRRDRLKGPRDHSGLRPHGTQYVVVAISDSV